MTNLTEIEKDIKTLAESPISGVLGFSKITIEEQKNGDFYFDSTVAEGNIPREQAFQLKQKYAYDYEPFCEPVVRIAIVNCYNHYRDQKEKQQLEEKMTCENIEESIFVCGDEEKRGILERQIKEYAEGYPHSVINCMNVSHLSDGNYYLETERLSGPIEHDDAVALVDKYAGDCLGCYNDFTTTISIAIERCFNHYATEPENDEPKNEDNPLSLHEVIKSLINNETERKLVHLKKFCLLEEDNGGDVSLLSVDVVKDHEPSLIIRFGVHSEIFDNYDDKRFDFRLGEEGIEDFMSFYIFGKVDMLFLKKNHFYARDEETHYMHKIRVDGFILYIIDFIEEHIL